MIDYYDMLGIAPDADQETIEAAYRKRLAEYDLAKLESASPELKTMARQRRAELQVAYQALSLGATGDEPQERRPLLTRRELLWSLGGAIVALVLLGVLWVTVGQEEAPPRMAVVEMPAPEVEMASLGGERVRLNQFRGKVVLVNFWATWCEPCKAETPALARSYSRLKDQGLEIIGVNIGTQGETREKVQAFMQRYGATYPTMLDWDNEVQRAFAIYPIPVSYFIDVKGTIRYIRIGELTEQEIEQTFRQLQQSAASLR